MPAEVFCAYTSYVDVLPIIDNRSFSNLLCLCGCFVYKFIYSFSIPVLDVLHINVCRSFVCLFVHILPLNDRRSFCVLGRES